MRYVVKFLHECGDVKELDTFHTELEATREAVHALYFMPGVIDAWVEVL